MMDYMELISWVGSACYDMAGGDEVQGDQNYNDPELLADMIGDRIFGSENFEEILCDLLDERGPLAKAAEMIIERL